METYKYELVAINDGRRELYNTLEEAVKQARKEGYYVVDRGMRPARSPDIVALLYKSKKLADIADEDFWYNEGEIRKIRVDCEKGGS
jgi:hypothetical protein